MRKIIFILAAGLLLQACDSADKKEPTKLDKMDWVLGYWEMRSPDGSSVTESWIRTDDTSYAGVGKFNDSTGRVQSSEEIRIVLRNELLWYIPTVSDQNGGQPVPFVEKEYSDSMVIFENMQHDFPQRIVYQRVGKDSLLAYIEGEIEGEPQRMEFAYAKQ